LQRFTSSAVYLSDPKLSPEQGAALQLKAWEGEFTSEEWRQIAWEWSRVFHREWSGASVLEIAAETGIPKKRLYRYEAREIELTVEEIEKWQSAIDNARKKNLAFVRDPSDTSDRGFDEVMTAIAAGHRAALCGIQARYRNRFRGTWGKLPAQSEPPVLGMKRGVLEHRKDLLARLENAGALTDPSLVGEIKETLRRDIQALEADLPAE
jgi:AcrR family transcriptional regulator